MNDNYLKEAKKMSMDALESAYRQGFEQGYKQGLESARISYALKASDYTVGLNDAWECVKKLSQMNPEDLQEFFGYTAVNFIIHNCVPTEVMNKIKVYETVKEEAKKKEGVLEIKVGDELQSLSTGRRCVVVKIGDYHIEVLWQQGDITSMHKSDLDKFKKTGTHYYEIDSVLEHMQGSSLYAYVTIGSEQNDNC